MSEQDKLSERRFFHQCVVAAAMRHASVFKLLTNWRSFKSLDISGIASKAEEQFKIWRDSKSSKHFTNTSNDGLLKLSCFLPEIYM